MLSQHNLNKLLIRHSLGIEPNAVYMEIIINLRYISCYIYQIKEISSSCCHKSFNSCIAKLHNFQEISHCGSQCNRPKFYSMMTDEKDSIRMDLKEMGINVRGWIYSSQGRDH